MRLRSFLRAAPPLVAPFLAAALLFVLACDGQQEGQVCSTYNGNADCANGLVCTPMLPNVNGARCCPQNRNDSTTSVCGTPMITTAPDSAAPPLTDGSAAGDGEAGDESTGATSPEATTDDGAAAGDGPTDAGSPPDATLDNDATPDSSADEASADAASE